MKASRRIAIVNLIFFIVMIAINYYAGSNVGIIANEKSALIQPAGYAFSIWILIFFLLFLWIVKGFFVHGKKVSVYIDTQILIPINFLLNGAWILAFTQQKILLSTVIILLLLLSIILIYRKIKQNVNRGLFSLVPFSIYLGWVSIASIVNVFTYFVRNDIETFLGIGELGWTVIMLIFGCALAVSFSLINQDALYTLVFIWSYIAIYVKNQEEIINLVTLNCIIIMSVTVLYVVISKVSRTK
ncbi:tryptophan-rich sensory protein [Sporosarcina sp. G11-34]|uniref:tryptophan-rich sensory protein n=1 Tax=Sporosarcina sp. G11-34 TaxID=2849605 RepID=UPI0022A8E8E7|nr:tryptophan-rich sensory protein [Sporosarcina sp. G11-34]MCZ2260834.1 tryptophan-rich sensory protein [Sporosarcina sp. G11-34]